MKVFYYTKYGCPLCDEGLEILRSMPGIEIEIIDIEDDPDRYHSYLVRIPVIAVEGTSKELCWPFDRDDIHHLSEGYGSGD